MLRDLIPYERECDVTDKWFKEFAPQAVEIATKTTGFPWEAVATPHGYEMTCEFPVRIIFASNADLNWIVIAPCSLGEDIAVAAVFDLGLALHVAYAIKWGTAEIKIENVTASTDQPATSSDGGD